MWKTINDILVNIDNFVWGNSLLVTILCRRFFINCASWRNAVSKTAACLKMDGKK